MLKTFRLWQVNAKYSRNCQGLCETTEEHSALVCFVVLKTDWYYVRNIPANETLLKFNKCV